MAARTISPLSVWPCGTPCGNTQEGRVGDPKPIRGPYNASCGKMVVVAVWAHKQSSSKAVLWVKFLSPPSHVDTQIQLYPKSLEPKNGPAKGQDFSLLSALELSHPGARSWKDLGVTFSTTSKATAGMLAALQAYHGGYSIQCRGRVC